MAIFENLVIEKGMYGVKNKSFTQVLEELDPSSNYKGTSLEGMDAFERQLKRFDIKVKGANSDSVEKFFSTSSSAALFPEYINRAVMQGTQTKNIIPDIVATTTKIDAMDYRSMGSFPEEENVKPAQTLEGALIPQTVLKASDKLVQLKKYGRTLVSSYEALRFQRIDLFTVFLRQIGQYMVRCQLEDAIDTLTSTKGLGGVEKTITKGSDPIDYKMLLKFYKELAPYDFNTLIVPATYWQDVMNIEEMKDANANLNFHGTGKMITPLGANLVSLPYIKSDKLIALDKNYALEFVKASEIVTEYDKIIDRQLERATITCISGFNKLNNEAIVIME